MTSKLSDFLDTATGAEREELAQAAATSVEYLVHLARGYGNREPKVGLALRIEKGTIAAHSKNPALPVVLAEDLARG